VVPCHGYDAVTTFRRDRRPGPGSATRSPRGTSTMRRDLPVRRATRPCPSLSPRSCPSRPDRADRACVGAVRRVWPEPRGWPPPRAATCCGPGPGSATPSGRWHCARRRARYMREHGGRVPGTVPELERLPASGPYTARAVAASAFGVPVAPLDVNVRRVVERVVGEAHRRVDSRTPRWARVAQRSEGVGRCRHGSGCTVCTARAPRCAACPLAGCDRSAGSIAEPLGPDPEVPGTR
jgi:A/G-specific adenine glycosylase